MRWVIWVSTEKDFQVKYLNGIQGLVCECIDARSLCDALSLENATELEDINIQDCNSMESLVSSSWFCNAPPLLPLYNGMFSGLKEFYCYGCKSMKKLFPLVLLSNLVNRIHTFERHRQNPMLFLLFFMEFHCRSCFASIYICFYSFCFVSCRLCLCPLA